MKVLQLYAEQSKNRGSFTSVAKRYAYFWEVNSYLNKRYEVTPIDVIMPQATLYAVSKELTLRNYQVVVMCIRAHNVERSLEYASFFKVCRPDVKIVAYGDIVSLIPHFFQQCTDFDAVVSSGDFELGIQSYLDYLQGGDSKQLSGVYVRELEQFFFGKTLANDWQFTDLSVAPYQIYNQMIIDKREMTITVQRGCPYDCSYCLATKTFAVKSRLKTADEILNYCFAHRSDFDTFRFFAPVFSLNREWAKDLCRRMIDAQVDFKWCTTTRYELLDDEELIDLMNKAGCYKVSVGVETVNDSASLIGRDNKLDVLRRVAGFVNRYTRDYSRQQGMTMVGLCMLGAPSQSKDDVVEMFSLMEELDMRIRPTSYSPLEDLVHVPNLTARQIASHDKFTFYENGIEGLSPQDYFRLIFNPKLYRQICQEGGSLESDVSGFRPSDDFMLKTY